MTTPPGRTRPPRLSLLIALVVACSLGGSAPAQAAAPITRSVEARALFADEASGFSIKRFFAGLNNRARVVQFCAVVMCIALFILMKKFSDGPRDDS